MSNTAIPQLGDTQNGYVFTENGWIPAKPPKKKRTFLKVFLALCAFGTVSVIAIIAMLGMAANEVSNSIEADANKPGGTDIPMTITKGTPFEVDGFNYAAGWQITRDGLGESAIPPPRRLHQTEDGRRQPACLRWARLRGSHERNKECPCCVA